jgi:hypothetical protein
MKYTLGLLLALALALASGCGGVRPIEAATVEAKPNLEMVEPLDLESQDSDVKQLGEGFELKIRVGVAVGEPTFILIKFPEQYHLTREPGTEKQFYQGVYKGLLLAFGEKAFKDGKPKLIPLGDDAAVEVNDKTYIVGPLYTETIGGGAVIGIALLEAPRA